MDIFAGLDELGFENIEIEDIYAEPEIIAHEEKKMKKPDKVVNEADLLFDKGYVCPACDMKFRAKTVRTGKYRLVSIDQDLKPRYDVIEPLKYEVILCNNCGFTATSRYFVSLAPSQRKMIKEKISANYKPRKDVKDTYSYDEAISKYKLALLCAVVKNAHASEKAYNCLKAGWLVRSYIESLEQEDISDEKKINELKALENDFLEKAYNGLITAMEHEVFPICGMDEYTLKILIAVLAKRFNHMDIASKLIADILSSRTCTSRIKDRARDLKDEILNMKKQ